jgi:hypothetical protein
MRKVSSVADRTDGGRQAVMRDGPSSVRSRLHALLAVHARGAAASHAAGCRRARVCVRCCCIHDSIAVAWLCVVVAAAAGAPPSSAPPSIIAHLTRTLSVVARAQQRAKARQAPTKTRTLLPTEYQSRETRRKTKSMSTVCRMD